MFFRPLIFHEAFQLFFTFPRPSNCQARHAEPRWYRGANFSPSSSPSSSLHSRRDRDQDLTVLYRGGTVVHVDGAHLYASLQGWLLAPRTPLLFRSKPTQHPNHPSHSQPTLSPDCPASTACQPAPLMWSVCGAAWPRPCTPSTPQTAPCFSPPGLTVQVFLYSYSFLKIGPNLLGLGFLRGGWMCLTWDL